MHVDVRRTRLAAALAAAITFAGCSAVTHMEPVSAGTTIALRGMPRAELPRDEKLNSKSTGQYEFMATTPSGQTLYGVLPLRVNGATMATSIALFAPALAIGGFRDAYPFYQVDPEAGLIRYKNKEADDWRLYKPSSAESNRAKAYFEALAEKCKADEKATDCGAAPKQN